MSNQAPGDVKLDKLITQLACLLTQRIEPEITFCNIESLPTVLIISGTYALIYSFLQTSTPGMSPLAKISHQNIRSISTAQTSSIEATVWPLIGTFSSQLP